jgi:hypothetical protein
VSKYILFVALLSSALTAYADSGTGADFQPSTFLDSPNAKGLLTFKIRSTDKADVDCGASIAVKNNVAVNMSVIGPTTTATWVAGNTLKQKSTPTQYGVTNTQAIVGNGASLDAIVRSLSKCKTKSDTAFTWTISRQQ